MNMIKMSISVDWQALLKEVRQLTYFHVIMNVEMAETPS